MTIRDAGQDMRMRTVQLACGHEVQFSHCSPPLNNDLILCSHCDRYVPVVACHDEQRDGRDPCSLLATTRVDPTALGSGQRADKPVLK
jgi:hypothetical protein